MLIAIVCVYQAREDGFKKFVASSGGNAGMAAAYTARNLGVPITIFVPKSTPDFMVERLKMEVYYILANDGQSNSFSSLVVFLSEC